MLLKTFEANWEKKKIVASFKCHKIKSINLNEPNEKKKKKQRDRKKKNKFLKFNFTFSLVHLRPFNIM